VQVVDELAPAAQQAQVFDPLDRLSDEFHSGRMPAYSITLRNFPTSALMIAAMSSGERTNRSRPPALTRCTTSGIAITLRASAAIRASASFGVPVRAISP